MVVMTDSSSVCSLTYLLTISIMKNFLFGLLLVLSGIFLFGAAVTSKAEPPAVPPQGDAGPNLTDSDIDQLEKDVENPTTRLAAISRLYSFSQFRYLPGSIHIVPVSAKRMARMRRAIEITKRHVEPETVSNALDSTDPTVQSWGITQWKTNADNVLSAKHRTPHFPPTGDMTPQEKVWHDLMPKVQKLAQNTPHAVEAIDALCEHAPEENRTYLLSLIPQQEDPVAVIHIMERLNAPQSRVERDEIYSAEILRRLQSPEVKKRILTLQGITYNSELKHGVFFRPHFSEAVHQRVEELKRSAEPEERAAAEQAAQEPPAKQK